MILALITSALILGWFLLLSALLLRFYVHWHGGRPAMGQWRAWQMVVPSIVLCPIVVVVAHRVLTWDLLFPTGFVSDASQLVPASLVPAALLLIISGFVVKAWHATKYEWWAWSQRSFVRTIAAFGGDPVQSLRPLLRQQLTWRLWQQCLPFVFGELVVVEVIFNAPGLGWEAFQRARARDMGGMVMALALLFAIYAVVSFWRHRQQRLLGERLAGYEV